MTANVLQAVLREAEAVAYCHRIQVWAEWEQVCIFWIFLPVTSGTNEWLYDLLQVDLLIKYLIFFPQILFADLIPVVIHIMIDDTKLVIW